jgi:spore coat polysaccharide biosynthesis predicted glycosyltransferase SpsG
VGLGHFKRCSLIAQSLIKCGFHCCFVVSEDDLTQIRCLEATNLDWLSLPSSSLYGNEVDYYPTNKAVFVDLQHKPHVDNPAPLIALLRSMEETRQEVVFIDGLGDEAFRHPEAPPVYAYVQPYFGADTDPLPRCNIWLKGPQYALLPPSFETTPQRCFSDRAENLLITFGGSDPQEITHVFLTHLLKSEGPGMKTRVVVGPFFSDLHQVAINSMLKQLRQKAWDIESVVAPPSMQALFDWADLAIGSSGGTKYEFCASGLPFLFCSIDQSHTKQSEAFSLTGAGLHLGYFEAIESSTWIHSIKSLSENQQKRQSMSALGRALIDGKGVFRLLCDLGLTKQSNHFRGHHE